MTKFLIQPFTKFITHQSSSKLVTNINLIDAVTDIPRLNNEGSVEKIFYNNQSRSRIMMGNADDTKHHYQAMKLLDDLAYRKDFLIECKLSNGKIPN